MRGLRRGQTVLEYTIIVGIVAMMLSYMGTSIKRGAQSLIKVTADQIGNQQNSEQDFNDAQSGFLQGSVTYTLQNKLKQVSGSGFINGSGTLIEDTRTDYNESTLTMTNSTTNGGFQPN